MNIYCVTASPVEPEDEKDLTSAICVTLLQLGYADIGDRDMRWDANAEFIAHAREDIPALIAEVERLQTLVKEMADTIEFYAGQKQLPKSLQE